MTTIEYRIRPITRYIVTKYESNEDSGSVGAVGSNGFDNEEMAYQVAYALARSDHERLGYALDDKRIKYPQHPSAIDTKEIG